MSIKTNAYENDVLNTMRTVALAAWTPYAALLTAAADPEASSVTAIAYTGYARIAVTFGVPSPAGTVANSIAATFGKMTGGAGGTVTHVGIYDAVAAGNLRYVIVLTASKVIGVDDTPEFAIGALVINEA